MQGKDTSWAAIIMLHECVRAATPPGQALVNGHVAHEGLSGKFEYMDGGQETHTPVSKELPGGHGVYVFKLP